MSNCNLTYNRVPLFPAFRVSPLVTFECGAGAVRAEASAENLTVTQTGPRAKAAALAARHQLAPHEVERLLQVVREWPAELVDQGLSEEVVDIMAGRELAQMAPFTVADVEAMQGAIDALNEKFDCVG